MLVRTLPVGWRHMRPAERRRDACAAACREYEARNRIVGCEGYSTCAEVGRGVKAGASGKSTEAAGPQLVSASSQPSGRAD
jgi:hypothetical protein